MAQLYFRYAGMNAGKTMHLLAIAHNYWEKGDIVKLMKPAIDDRDGVGIIASRTGLKQEADIIKEDDDLFQIIDQYRLSELLKHDKKLACVLIDEGQFLTREHVLQLCRVVDELKIPVIVFGLKTDFQGNLFPGSEALLCFADKIEEMKTVCWHCNRKASYNMRIDPDGKKVTEGPQILIGGNDTHIPVCRYHFLYDEDREYVGA